MFRPIRALPLALILPLAGCFDAEVSLEFLDTQTLYTDAYMTMAPEMYAMARQVGQDPCEGGMGVARPDGSFTCSFRATENIDTAIAMAEAQQNSSDSMISGIAEGYTVERIGPDRVRMSVDLTRMQQNAGVGDQIAGMEDMLRARFTGHGLNFIITAAEILETNGTLSADRRQATFYVPLTRVLETDPTLPGTFYALVDLDG